MEYSEKQTSQIFPETCEKWGLTQLVPYLARKNWLQHVIYCASLLAKVGHLGCVANLVSHMFRSAFGQGRGQVGLLGWIFCTAALFGSEFSVLMGEDEPEWIYLSKGEDVAALERFDDLFERNWTPEFSPSNKAKIPYVIHFVWLGPEEPSKENIASWIDAHPGWEFKLWSDRHFDLDDLSIQLKDASAFPFLFSKEQWEQTESFEEKADLLRFEILYQEGGLAVDLRVKCLKSFTPLHQTYDLFCGLNSPHPPIGGRNISMTNELIGARPFHPVIGKMVRSAPTPLIEALLDRLEEDGNVDIVLPARYFFSQEGYATSGEVTMPRHIARTLNKKREIPEWLASRALPLNLVALGGAWLIFAIRKRRRTR